MTLWGWGVGGGGACGDRSQTQVYLCTISLEQKRGSTPAVDHTPSAIVRGPAGLSGPTIGLQMSRLVLIYQDTCSHFPPKPPPM